MSEQTTTTKKKATASQRLAYHKNRLTQKITVVIPRPENVRGETDTTVSVNGRIYQIMYDVPVQVPRYVAEVIENSRKMQSKIREFKERSFSRAEKPAIAEL